MSELEMLTLSSDMFCSNKQLALPSAHSSFISLCAQVLSSALQLALGSFGGLVCFAVVLALRIGFTFPPDLRFYPQRVGLAQRVQVVRTWHSTLHVHCSVSLVLVTGSVLST